LPPQGDPAVGDELIRVHHPDGTTEELRLHDYARLYALPGVYETIVQERLGCRSPAQIAELLAQAIDGAGWDRAATRVIDLAAGNGVSGEALAAQGLRPVLGSDIVPAARHAALRDRPELYDAYLTLDLLSLPADVEHSIADLHANALASVAPVGEAPGELPPGALAAAVGLLAPDAIVAYMHDPDSDDSSPDLAPGRLAADLGAHVEELERRRYVHRYTVNGRPYEMDAVVLRIRRDGSGSYAQ
jgi:predicted TPR repeat methyltransferase